MKGTTKVITAREFKKNLGMYINYVAVNNAEAIILESSSVATETGWRKMGGWGDYLRR